MKEVLAATRSTFRDPRRDQDNDPVRRLRMTLPSDPARLEELEGRIEKEVQDVLALAVEGVPS